MASLHRMVVSLEGSNNQTTMATSLRHKQWMDGVYVSYFIFSGTTGFYTRRQLSAHRLLLVTQYSRELRDFIRAGSSLHIDSGKFLPCKPTGSLLEMCRPILLTEGTGHRVPHVYRDNRQVNEHATLRHQDTAPCSAHAAHCLLSYSKWRCSLPSSVSASLGDRCSPDLHQSRPRVTGPMQILHYFSNILQNLDLAETPFDQSVA